MICKKVITICITFLILLPLLSGCHTAHEVEEAYNRGYTDGLIAGQRLVDPTPTATPATRSATSDYPSPDEFKPLTEEAVAAMIIPSLPSTPSPAPADPPKSDVHDYVLNTNSHKFHYPSCSSVDQMKDSNKQYFTGTREEVISMGYDPCGNCHP